MDNLILETTYKQLHKPHLLIYLDIPIELSYERMQKKYPGNKALTLDFLRDLDYYLKESFLRHMNNFCYMICYDWTEPADFEFVVEDIEAINFDNYEKRSEKISDWRIIFDEHYNVYRKNYANMRHVCSTRFNVHYMNVEGLVSHFHDKGVKAKLYTNYVSSFRYMTDSITGL